MKFPTLALSILLVASTLQAAPAETGTSTKSLMDRLLIELNALKKFMVSEAQFTDPKNEAEIARHLKEFAELSKKAKHDTQLKQASFKFSQQILQDHLGNTERVFRLGNKSYARWMLNSTVSVCVSCHTQAPSASRNFGEFLSLKPFTSEFEQAEFLFAARSFDKASDLFDRVILHSLSHETKADQVETALERQLTYFSRVKRDPAQAIAKFEAYAKPKKLPVFLQKNVEAWIEQLKAWSKQKSLNPQTASEEEVLQFAKTQLSADTTSEVFDAANPFLVNYLRVSGILFEYLQSHPDGKATPQILYWLAICDRAIGKDFLYSLADLYLRECMTKYPADPIALSCYKDYETETILGYSGSSGVHVPADVAEELRHLKNTIQAAQKRKK